MKPFFETIYRLRNKEEVLLFESTLTIDSDDASDVLQFLHAEWDNECLEYPHVPPSFHEAAALWGARTLYLASQLILNRELMPEDLDTILSLFDEAVDASAMLSADLCLRMLPVVVQHLEAIDPDDPLIPRLRSFLKQFHYSGIGCLAETDDVDLSPVIGSRCATQLYADRIIGRRDRLLAKRPEIAPALAASLGEHKQYYWHE